MQKALNRVPLEQLCFVFLYVSGRFDVSFLFGLSPSANVDGGFEVSPLFCASNRAAEWAG